MPNQHAKLHVKLNASTSASELIVGMDLSHQVVIVTGANTGIGFETARALAAAGARVILACRSAEKAQAAVDKILQLHPKSQAECLPLDLARVDSITAFGTQLNAEKIDTLICNAGLVTPTYEQTQEGIEKTVGVCHYGHFLLTRLLLPRLLKAVSPRVIMVSSESHRSPKTLDFDCFPLTPNNFSMFKAYGQAKLANTLMANELQRRYGDQGLTACSLHPGALVTTDIGRGSLLMRGLMVLISPFTKNVDQGASTTVYCATEEDTGLIAGQYYSHCQTAKMSDEAANQQVAEKLWAISDAWADSVLSE
ncbi:MAG: NAD(P)-dependent dehydrogenase (short-subunit alcohol dehydrogenase family) [Candidatus Pseudothioglobus sp.]|jgi:NAD(P)-dependent dehydrogenase (short-subunit alcohol dehydrogenase family)